MDAVDTKSPAVIQALFSLAPKMARGVGENRCAVIPSKEVKEPAQKSTTDVNDNKRHLKIDIFERNLSGPSMIPPFMCLLKTGGDASGLSPA